MNSMQNHPGYWRDILNQILETDITEARIDWLRKNYPARIQQRLHTLRMPGSVRNHLETEQGNTEAEKLINWVAGQDPSKNHAYTQWMLDRIIKQDRPMPLEDVIYAREILTAYEQAKKDRLLSPEQQDINRFDNLSAVQAAVKQQRSVKQQQDAATQAAEAARARQEGDILFESSDTIIVAPKTMFAAQYWGRGSDWCTAYGDPYGNHPDRDENAFDTYYQGPRSIIIVRNLSNQDKMYQLAESELKNVKDLNASISDLAADFPPALSLMPVAKLIKTLGSVDVFAAGKHDFYMMVYTGGSDDLPDGPVVCLRRGTDAACWEPWSGTGGAEWMTRNISILNWVKEAVDKFSQSVDSIYWTGGVEKEPEEIAQDFMDGLLLKGF